MVHDKSEHQLTHVKPGEESFAVAAPRLVGALRLDAMPLLDHAVEPIGFLHALVAAKLQRHRRDGDQHRFTRGLATGLAPVRPVLTNSACV
jgi:type VI protein secretion system component VasA